MISLLELQRSSARAFRDGDDAALGRWLVGGAQAMPRIRVYQNNLLESARKTLASSYPVVCALVGNDCFRTLARDYVRRHPSRSGDLQHFGARFPLFLDCTYRDSEYAYLESVARLEWACEVVRGEADDERTALDLGGIAADNYPALCFRLQRALRLVRSSHPILSIWRANQPGCDGHADLGAGGEHVVVIRTDADVELFGVDASAFAFIDRLQRGATLAEAIDTGLAVAAGFDPLAALGLIAARGLVTGCSPAASDVNDPLPNRPAGEMT